MYLEYSGIVEYIPNPTFEAIMDEYMHSYEKVKRIFIKK